MRSPGSHPIPQDLQRRHSPTWLRISLMIGVGLYSCSSDDRPVVIAEDELAVLAFVFRLRGFGTGVMSSDLRRPWTGGTSSG